MEAEQPTRAKKMQEGIGRRHSQLQKSMGFTNEQSELVGRRIQDMEETVNRVPYFP